MTSFLPVNRTPTPNNVKMEDVTSTTPRPDVSSDSRPSTSKTDSSQPHSVSSHRRAPSTASTGDETTVADDEPDRDQTDNEPDNGENAPPSKKKKGQRFFCTDFPPCTLSFTRSEHLARHIRKHTGERPFQCHCSRRFSRLDNLRQHAQTVHVNEDIPGDSLAATGTRFQRQIRTDRVRPPQGRARAGTTGSQGGHARGHSRNLSTSSIASTASSLSQAPDLRRRPPPLIMANDGGARAQLPLGTMAEPTTPPSQIVRSVPGPSPGHGYPTFSAGGGMSSHYASPIAAASHQPGYWDARGHARRLSVPSGPNPFTNHETYPPPHVTSIPPSHAPYAPGSSVYASPTSSSVAPSRDEGMSPSEAELRRRTWHPSTYPRPTTSGLVKYEESANTLRPAFGAGNTDGQGTRLPGIESFDKVIQGRPLTPPLRKPSPMQIDTPSRGPPYTPGFAGQVPSSRPPPAMSGLGHRRAQPSWDLHYNLTGLSLGNGSASLSYKEATTTWGQQPFASTSRQEPSTPQNTQRYSFQAATTTPGSQVTRTSPEDSSSSEGVATPSTVSMEYHPAIVHSNGHVEPAVAHEAPNCAPSQQNGYTPTNRPGIFENPSAAGASGMGRLEALVAVATSEGKSAARLF
ncbi:hypothetical protein EYB25_001309 [Talaromyces marneffei]|uniref:uncharacterized protein n=1 Tax=Talaromyces marneffei TaxID=37727 RepID=UPI0012A93D3F|nr:uncharacterized protein EYB26_001027 [Talaromyces marneffei]KAE8556607.1 hypothetical protein EYB25_001309 [Talaromyces marneffei]QGA13378.1 hypothetical protein EYB26_001027 [Talaromyces marneffei]